MSCKGPLFTYVSSCGKSVVDYICLSNCMRTKINCIEVVDEHQCNLSHHLPLIVRINVDGDITDGKIFNKSGREYERIAWRKCTLEHFSEFQRRLNDAVLEMDDTLSNADDIDHYYSVLCQCVKKSDECLPRVKYKQFVKPYWNNELKQLKSTCMKYHKRWCLEGRPRGEQFENFRLYKNAKRLFRKEQRRMIRKSEENDFEELSDAAEIDNIKFWKYVNRRRNRRTVTNVFTLDDGGSTSQPDEIAGLWANYYENLLTPEENTDFDDKFKGYVDNEVSEITKNSIADIDDIFQHPITETEIKNILTLLPNNKAPGDDGITYEHVRFSGEVIVKKLVTLYNKIVELEYIPKNFKLGIKIPIPKGGKICASKFDDHRGITLLCSFNKIFERIVLKRLQQKIRCQPHPLQGAYQAEHDALTTSFIIDESIKHCCEENDKVFACYVDVSKAFDKVWINGMLFKLYYNAKIVGKSWRLIKSWYSDLKEYVFYQGACSRQYSILQGVRQGGVLSPWLFLLFIDDLIKELQKLSTGIAIHNLYTGSPMFADDLTLMSRLKRGLDSMLAQAHQYSLRWRLTFNEGKTVVLTYGEGNASSEDREWLIGGKKIVEKSVWHNLGKNWHTDVDSLVPIIEAAKSGQTAGISLANVGCTFNGINPLVAVKLWKRIALPKMLYGAELWTLNRMKLSTLEKVQNTFLRVCLGLLGGTSGSAARGFVGLWSIEAEVDKRKLLFLRRLIHASEQCIHHRVFIIRLTRWKWNPNKITGFLPDIVRILKKYSLLEYLDYYLQTGNFPSKSEWKRVVVESLKKVENEEWGKKIHCYDQLRLYKHVIKELAPNMWLRMGLDNTKMADNVSLIVKVLCGSFYVNSERFSGQDEVFYCKSCGNYYINPIKHAMLHCCETQLEREEFWQRVSDNLPVEFLVQLNSLDEDVFLNTIFGNTETLQQYWHGNMELFYNAAAEFIAQTVKTTSYIKIFLDN